MMANYSSKQELVMMSSQISNDADSDYEELPSPDIECDETDDSIKRDVQGFSIIHENPKSFKDPSHQMLLSKLPVNLQIIDVERSPGTHILNPNLYIIQLQHGNHEWVIKKRYKHFQHLHQQLRLFRTGLSIPLPTKKHKAKRKSYRHLERKHLPRFPRKPDALIPQEQVEMRTKQLEEYLKCVLQITLYRNHYEMMEFLEISPLSFVQGLGNKNKEGLMQKKSGGHTSVSCFRLKRGCIDWCGSWRWRWFIVKDTWLAYMRPKDGRVRSVLLMDGGFRVERGFVSTGIHHGLQISNLSRNLLIRCGTRRRAIDWAEALTTAANTTAKDFTQPNRFGSFAPVRAMTQCRWFVDGATYFEAVADALENAREEIFIADWWLSPELYMKRPVIQGEIYRLDHILRRKAEQGVKVFVLLYKEVELALGINSLYSKQQLVRMHKNIKVLRHPDHLAGGTLFWAHHEKIVCIDQTYAFLGGIDLCYGRWDDYQHRLSDLGGVVKCGGPDHLEIKTSAMPKGSPLFKRSYSTSDISGNGQIPDYKQSPPSIQVAKCSDSGAPFIDEVDHIQILVQQPSPNTSQILPPSTDFAENNSASEITECAEAPPLLCVENNNDASDTTETLDIPPRHYTKSPVKDEPQKRIYNIAKKLRARRVMQAVGQLQALNKRIRNKSLESIDSVWDTLDIPSGNLRRTASEIALSELGLEGEAKLWIGKDYINFIVKDFEHLHRPYEDSVDRHTTPRMPWHDIGVFVQGAAAKDVARHFIQRWNFTKFEKAKYYDRYQWLLPKAYEDFENIPPLQLNATDKLLCADCQILRSAGPWSAGIQTTEQSIHNAYIDVIQNAVHYVYIENQFFISQSEGHKDVYNKICDALYERILKAHREGSVFRVFVVMPLLPAFEGEIGTDSGTAIQAITHWNYASICRGSYSIWQRLSKEVGDPSTYITFFGLRKHGSLTDKLTTELIYVHSKMLIADDRVALIGSANINDRSMLGDRDSEIAVIMRDIDFEDSLMNGKEYKAGCFAGSLRRTIFREHLGYIGSSAVDIRDPVKDQFYKDIWIRTAALNSSIFEKVFHCVPSDAVRTYTQLRTYLSKPCLASTDSEHCRNLLSGIQGHLVLLPLQFLCEENLSPPAGTKESLMPVSLWT